ncbi:methylated-DNA--[protein]-cysteine S-methyltransferase [Marinitenerispora sediminis]|uniref:Methylated-DNA--protein-cysteine methyltransferase n=1 Tax=Marinitenerispora sediminis TaxID=1931232 RepID=A0A368T8R3_9ACTN|nr:methylated-DNA--[protein]-cysteine S-methyltransferase [Marinitenerispora sediminis]RCV55444.1 cysteine methyltransferase [Marinitenerispora sediminis]RCV60790.1 cysteine methyltransferase [Marinitenerispora sediminis]RCV61741.1 cysteine methyltransferase [Marinitenerispora sediminis]
MPTHTRPPVAVQDALPLAVTASEPEEVAAVEFAAPEAGPTRYTLLPSPIGEILLTGDGAALTGLYMRPEAGWERTAADWRRDDGAFAETKRQLAAYFAGELREFSVPLAPSGTPFQLRVWRTLTTIPYGRTTSYGEIAARLGRPTASRAVGMANGRNPISIIVPCHRVIGANGALTGYGGGLPRKERLLRLERSTARTAAPGSATG